MRVIGSEDLYMPSSKKELRLFKKQKMPEWTHGHIRKGVTGQVDEIMQILLR